MTDEELARYFAYGVDDDRVPDYQGQLDRRVALVQMLRRLEYLGVITIEPTAMIADIIAQARVACREWLARGGPTA